MSFKVIRLAVVAVILLSPFYAAHLICQTVRAAYRLAVSKRPTTRIYPK